MLVDDTVLIKEWSISELTKLKEALTIYPVYNSAAIKDFVETKSLQQIKHILKSCYRFEDDKQKDFVNISKWNLGIEMLLYDKNDKSEILQKIFREYTNEPMSEATKKLYNYIYILMKDELAPSLTPKEACFIQNMMSRLLNLKDSSPPSQSQLKFVDILNLVNRQNRRNKVIVDLVKTQINDIELQNLSDQDIINKWSSLNPYNIDT